MRRRIAASVVAIAAAATAPILTPTAAHAADTYRVAVDAQLSYISAAESARLSSMKLGSARVELARSQQQLTDATAVVASMRTTVGQLAREAYIGTAAVAGPSTTPLYLLLGDATSASEMLDRTATIEHLSGRNLEAINSAQAEVDAASSTIAASEATVATAQTDVDRSTAEAATARAAADAAIGELGGGSDPDGDTSVQQQVLNEASQLYFGAASSATDGERAPAAELADPAALPTGLSAVLDEDGGVVPGVAVGTAPDAVVIPDEADAVVDAALAAVGTTVADGWSCSSLTASLWGAEGFALPALPAEQLSATVEVPADTVQLGDLVFERDRTGAVEAVGVYVGGGMMVSARHGVVQTREWRGDTVTRPSLGVAPPTATQPPSELVCGDSPAVLNASAWTSPYAAAPLATAPVNVEDYLGGVPTPTASSVTAVEPESDGETAAATTSSPTTEPEPELPPEAADATTLLAITSGVVTSVDGSTVVVDHGYGYVGTYTGVVDTPLYVGARLWTGSLLGFGDDLAARMEHGGETVDATTYLNAAATNPGGYANGRIPEGDLCTVADTASHRLRCDAARALDMLRAAYEAETGSPLSFTDSYRDYAGQVRCRELKGSLCAVPGTSNHGWGMAVDFASGVETVGTPASNWMEANAARFGWIHPSWALVSGGKPEAWHWEFLGSAAPTMPTTPAVAAE